MNAIELLEDGIKNIPGGANRGRAQEACDQIRAVFAAANAILETPLMSASDDDGDEDSEDYYFVNVASFSALEAAMEAAEAD